MPAWDHNAYYHRLVLRRLPQCPTRILDVGCGGGVFAARLAARAEHVDALDRSPVMIRAARAATPANVDCMLGDVMTHPLASGAYDAVVSIGALHHLQLQPVLQRLAGALRPGGVLVAIALPRVDLPREIPLELTAIAYHHLLGMALTVARRSGLAQTPSDRSQVNMPTLIPTLTTRQVRQQAASVLPGAMVRRLLLWRYLLSWTKPT